MHDHSTHTDWIAGGEGISFECSFMFWLHADYSCGNAHGYAKAFLEDGGQVEQFFKLLETGLGAVDNVEVAQFGLESRNLLRLIQ